MWQSHLSCTLGNYTYKSRRNIENKKYKNYPNIDIVGLMGMATNTDNVEQVKNEFLYLKSVFHKAEMEIENSNFKIISMGMSNDYKLAIECGSNMIRVGSALFN
jgi:uncharacterized pyridoxal phosphate-containing UPF0001 family protein